MTQKQKMSRGASVISNGVSSNTILEEPAVSLTLIGEEDPLIMDIDRLADHGVDQRDIARLKENGIHTVRAAHCVPKRRMEKDYKGLSDIRVAKIKEAVDKLLPGSWMSGGEWLELRKRCFKITTSSRQLDGILCGGFQTMSVCEVFGEYRCGKTQLAHTLAVTAQLPRDMGGAEGKVFWLDTEGAFRPERIGQICERFGVDCEQALDNIHCSRVDNSEHQEELLKSMAPALATNEYRLVIIDSLMNLFRTDYIGRGELFERQSAVARFLRQCAQLAEEFNCVFYMTNQVQSDPGASSLFASLDGRKPIGGHVVAHASTTRILVRKGRGEERVAKIVDSPEAAEREGSYIITNGGINDANAA